MFGGLDAQLPNRSPRGVQSNEIRWRVPQTGDHDAHHHSFLFDCLLSGVKEKKGGGGPTATAISGMRYILHRNDRSRQSTPSFPRPWSNTAQRRWSSPMGPAEAGAGAVAVTGSGGADGAGGESPANDRP